jgi:hypothetical protein
VLDSRRLNAESDTKALRLQQHSMISLALTMTVSGILRPKGVCGLQIDRKFELIFRSAQDGWSEAIPINCSL